MSANKQPNPERDIFMSTEHTSQTIPVDWKSFWTPFAEDLCIHDLLYQQAEQRPDAIAIHSPDGDWTYTSLIERVNFLASRLRTLGVQPGTLVGIAVERTPDMVAALYAILEAGGAYVPVDPYYPPERVAIMLEDADVQCLITQSHLLTQLPTLQSEVFLLDKEITSPTDRDLNAPRATPQDLAYAMYTSGSTGRPKCAQIQHQGIVNLIEAMQDAPGFSCEDTGVGVISLSHDMSVADIFVTLSSGARLVIAPRESAKDGVQLATLLNDVKATYISATPSIFRMLLDVDWHPIVPIKCLAAGEALPADIIPPMLERGCHVWNGYGMTEASVYSTLTPITAPDASITIGGRMKNTTIYILNEKQKPVQIGEVGELYVGGIGVGPGYLERPKLNAYRFLDDPFSPQFGHLMYRSGDLARFLPNGDIECLGRIDHQVKIRGFRVELGSIEACLNAHPDVQVSALNTYQDISKNRALAAYIVPNSEIEDDVLHQRCRTHIAQHLPEHMVPSQFVTMQTLPLTPAGKIDRRALPVPEQLRPALAGQLEAPDTPQETILCSIFADVLGLEEVGATDDFFLLGGHSILAARLSFRIHERCKVQLPVHEIFTHPTPRQLAPLLDTHNTQITIPIAAKDQPLPLTFPQQGLWFIHQLDPTHTEYHISTILTISGPLNRPSLQQAIDAFIARHDALHSVLTLHEGQPTQHTLPPTSAHIPIIDVSHLPTKEKEKQATLFSRESFRRLFDLQRGPLIRNVLLRLDEEHHQLLTCVHHIISDGWTIDIFFRELTQLYAKAQQLPHKELPTLRIQGADVASWQHTQWREGAWDADIQSWKQTLQDLPQISLPLLRPKPQRRSVEGASYDITLREELVEQMHTFNRQEGLTPYMFLLTVYGLLLHQETSQTDLPIGTVMANRGHQELEHIFDFFANTLVMRLQPSPQETFRAYAKAVKQHVLSAFSKQHIPFELLVQELAPNRQQDQQPLFQTCFILQDPPTETIKAGETSFDIVEVHNGSAPFDLTFQLWEEREVYKGNFLYRTDIFTHEEISVLCKQFGQLLQQVLDTPDQPLTCFSSSRWQQSKLALQSLPAIEDIEIIPRAHKAGHIEPIAYVVSSRPPSLETCQQILRDNGLPAIQHLLSITRIPTAQSGDVDKQALLRIPLYNEDTIKDLQSTLEAIPEVVGAMVMKQMHTPVTKPHHIDDCLPASLRRHTHTHSTKTTIQTDTPSEHTASPSLVEGPQLTFPEDAPKTFPEALRRAADRAPTSGITTLAEDGQEHFRNYPALLDEALRIATGLHRSGLKKGDIVLMQLPDNGDFVAGLWGCIMAEVVAVPIATPISYTNKSAQLDKLHNACALFSHPPILMGTQAHTGLEDKVHSQQIRIETLRASEPLQAPIHPAPEDLVMMLLTSGSTGMPKAVRHQHQTIFSHTEGYSQHHSFVGEDTFLNWLPMDHVGGLFMCHVPALYLGANQVHIPTQSFLQRPTRWLDWMQQYNATVSWAPNFAFGLVNQEQDALDKGSWDLSSMRVMMNGGEAIVPRTARQFLERLGKHKLSEDVMVPVWGMSELSSAVVTHLDFSLENTSDTDAFTCVGTCIPGFAMRIVDDEGQLLPRHQEGKLEVRGPSVMEGYHQLEEVNAASFAEDRWFDTGDLAFIDEHDRLTITGRRKDVIIVNGTNFYSHEIEAVIEKLPGVKRSFTAACAIREAGDETDQLIIFLVLQDDNKEQWPTLLKSIRGQVASQIGLSPRYILPVQEEDIPKTEIGKIQRTKLKQAFETGTFRSLARDIDILMRNERTLPPWLYKRTWQPSRIEHVTSTPQGKVLVFTHKTGLSHLVTTQLEAQGVECIKIYPETEKVALPKGHYQVSMTSRDSHIALREQLTEDGVEPAYLLHLWTLHGSPQETDFTRSQEEGVFSLLALFQAWEDTKLPLHVVSRQTQGYKTHQPDVHHGTMHGLLLTFSHESQGLQARHIDVEDTDVPSLTSSILDEWSCSSTVYEVVYREGKRYTPALRAFSPQSSAPQSLPLLQGDGVLVTGGLGGIGYEVCQELLRRLSVQLLLIGRRQESALDEVQQRKLSHLQQLAQEHHGSCVYVAADLTSSEVLSSIVASQEETWGRPLKGIFHIAALFRSVPLQKEVPEGFREVYPAKVEGTRSLVSLAKQREGILFVDFSSINSYMGGFSAGAYAAAGRFAEPLLASLSKETGAKVYCLSWTRWKQLGMSLSLPGNSLTQAKGYLEIPVSQGLSSMWTALAHTPGTWLIGLDRGHPHTRRWLLEEDVSQETLKAWVTLPKSHKQTFPEEYRDMFGVLYRPDIQELETQQGHQKDASVVLSRPTVQVEHTAPRHESEQQIASIWRNLLEVEQVGIDDNFFDLGGHSLLMARMQHRLEQVFEKEIPIVELFRFPTIRLLAEYVSGPPGTSTPPKRKEKREERTQKQKTHLARARKAMKKRRK